MVCANETLVLIIDTFEADSICASVRKMYMFEVYFIICIIIATELNIKKFLRMKCRYRHICKCVNEVGLLHMPR
jgi:hypothetical protein